MHPRCPHQAARRWGAGAQEKAGGSTAGGGHAQPPLELEVELLGPAESRRQWHQQGAVPSHQGSTPLLGGVGAGWVWRGAAASSWGVLAWPVTLLWEDTSAHAVAPRLPRRVVSACFPAGSLFTEPFFPSRSTQGLNPSTRSTQR